MQAQPWGCPQGGPRAWAASSLQGCCTCVFLTAPHRDAEGEEGAQGLMEVMARDGHKRVNRGNFQPLLQVRAGK